MASLPHAEEYDGASLETENTYIRHVRNANRLLEVLAGTTSKNQGASGNDASIANAHEAVPERFNLPFYETFARIAHEVLREQIGLMHRWGAMVENPIDRFSNDSNYPVESTWQSLPNNGTPEMPFGKEEIKRHVQAAFSELTKLDVFREAEALKDLPTAILMKAGLSSHPRIAAASPLGDRVIAAGV